MDFVAIKKTVGDIDTQVDMNLESMLKTFLDESIGKNFNGNKFIGYKVSPGQFMSLWHVTELGINVQIDFELVEYHEGSPTGWAQFSHSSAWEDLNSCIKGAFHKFLLQSILAPSAVDMVIKAKTSRGKDKFQTKAASVFSVSNGLRKKYEPVLDDSGNHMEHQGSKVYSELSTSESNGERDITKMYLEFFGAKAKLQDEELLWSFVGIIALIKKYKPQLEHKVIVDDFVERLWGKGAQGLYRGDPQTDLNEKGHAIKFICDELGVDINHYNNTKAEYYKNYK
jgi:hypothetical protein